MSKIYIFGIGGTGSRVLRSLTMLLSAGVDFGATEIVPIIIDPDASNADLTRTIDLMKLYANMHDYSSGKNNQFFKTKIDKESVGSNYTLNIDGTNNKAFKQFVGYPSMSKANKALTKMLFSTKNLDSSMNVGFKGNPNIGSVVLNQISTSTDFTDFANSFNDGDRIFIISSIFGGTGASGFPLLLKTLRTGKNIPQFNLIQKAPIGALTVLPYFKIKRDDNSEIDSSTFISKAKSALAYYENNIRAINAMYFLADGDMQNIYENHDGGNQQQNSAHLIELFGATAIIHFSNTVFDSTSTNYLELGVNDLDQSGSVSFLDLYNDLRKMLYSPMVQFALVANAYTYNLNYFKSDSFNANKTEFKNLYSSQFFIEFKKFIADYKKWIDEMQTNSRKLDFFDLSCGEKKPFDLVKGKKAKKVFSLFSNYDLFADRLNSCLKDCNSTQKEDKFLEMLSLGTKKLVKEKLK